MTNIDNTTRKNFLKILLDDYMHVYPCISQVLAKTVEMYRLKPTILQHNISVNKCQN